MITWPLSHEFVMLCALYADTWQQDSMVWGSMSDKERVQRAVDQVEEVHPGERVIACIVKCTPASTSKEYSVQFFAWYSSR